MTKVKKYKTVEDLKAIESTNVNHSSRSEKHNAFEKFIREVSSLHLTQKRQVSNQSMEDILKNSLLTVCRSLEKYKVDYMLIGGTAVALNGYYRISINIKGEMAEKPDIDMWYNLSRPEIGLH